MAVFVFVVLILAMTGYSSATWCVCRNDVSDTALQKALDYACGAGADCTPIHQNGACYQPNTVRAHCSYAVNSYFQRKGQAQGTCEFANSAIISASDPSTAGSCVYPSSLSSAGNSTTPATSTTPSTGVLGGGIGSGLGPTSYTDTSDGGGYLQKTILSSLLLTLLFSGFVFMCG
ncbi:hypothetical protein HHK36_007344 [Tetracentron sinense]|uniref:X8 domain-containing protein n=1 Tax=Tetracentron sinense TaxID=13715 RepID=A0A834ZRJ6_TETSI|nr:hypothetical protein HHK36_007344 [Tetracentron sinense]